MYIADQSNNRVRKVNTSGIISTIAGIGVGGFSGDGGLAINAELREPTGLVFDISGNLYIGDLGNNLIREVNTSGSINNIAGNIYAGYSGDGGAAIDAELSEPMGMGFDSYNNLYISDGFNCVVRMINQSYIINTVAGNGFGASNGNGSYSGDGGIAIDAELNDPFTIVFNGAGDMFISDLSNNRIREITGLAGINDLKYKMDIITYPNPAVSQLNLKLNNFRGKITLTLYNIFGQQVWTTISEGKDIITFNVSKLSTGLYILKAQPENGDAIMQKVEIMR